MNLILIHIVELLGMMHSREVIAVELCTQPRVVCSSPEVRHSLEALKSPGFDESATIRVAVLPVV